MMDTRVVAFDIHPLKMRQGNRYYWDLVLNVLWFFPCFEI